MSQDIYIIDGHAQIYRAFYAVEGLRSPTGEPVNAIFQFTRMLMHLIKEQNPTRIIAVFDAPGKNFRHEIFPEYKANRKPAPEELKVQIPQVIELVREFNIPVLSIEGYEADDIIGVVTKLATKAGLNSTIVSGDKDLAQLLNNNVRLFDPKKNQYTTESDFYDENGFPPEKLTDLMGLWGDTADNIPGVAGIGKKIGRELIQKYKTLENLLDRASEIKGKRGETLLKSKEIALLSKELATLKLDANVDIDLDDTKLKEPNYSVLRGKFVEYGFKILLNELEHQSPAPKETRDYQLINTPEKFAAFLPELKNTDHFSLDTETTGLDPMQAKLVGISLSFAEKSAFYLPFMGLESESVLTDSELNKLKPILEAPTITKSGQNLKYDTIILKRNGIEVNGVNFDTLIGSSLIEGHIRGHDLDSLASRHLGIEKIPTKEIIGTASKEITMDKAGMEKVAEYACEDADVTLRLEKIFKDRLNNEEKKLLAEIELPLSKVLTKMQLKGIRVNGELLKSQSKELDMVLDTITTRIFEIAGKEFNIASPKQLSAIMFDELEYPPIKKTKTGYSTDESVLKELANQGFELPELLLEYRQYSKLKSTYLDALPKMINPETGRIHTTFSQTTTTTGRLSSSNPNLQNIPIRSEKGRAIRAAFIPEEGWQMLAADYSQVELRMLAHFSEDIVLTKAFKNNEDIHKVVASEINDIPLDEVTSEQRYAAKAINFGIIYGQTAHGLSQTTGMTRFAAQQFIDSYFQQFPNIKDFIESTIAQAHIDGGIRTMHGRFRSLPELSASKRVDKERGEREALNTLIQGSAAELIKIAMLNVDSALQSEGLKANMLLQIHDELVFESHPDDLNKLEALVRREMEGAMSLNIPLKVDIGTGSNWLALK